MYKEQIKADYYWRNRLNNDHMKEQLFTLVLTAYRLFPALIKHNITRVHLCLVGHQNHDTRAYFVSFIIEKEKMPTPSGVCVQSQLKVSSEFSAQSWPVPPRHSLVDYRAVTEQPLSINLLYSGSLQFSKWDRAFTAYAQMFLIYGRGLAVTSPHYLEIAISTEAQPLLPCNQNGFIMTHQRGKHLSEWFIANWTDFRKCFLFQLP